MVTFWLITLTVLGAANGQNALRLVWNGTEIPANSSFPLENILDNSRPSDVSIAGLSLVCVTDQVNQNCCRSSDGDNTGNWFFPDGTIVPREREATEQSTFTRTGYLQQVRLNRKLGRESYQYGVYQCLVPNRERSRQFVISINLTPGIPDGTEPTTTNEQTIQTATTTDATSAHSTDTTIPSVTTLEATVTTQTSATNAATTGSESTTQEEEAATTGSDTTTQMATTELKTTLTTGLEVMTKAATTTEIETATEAATTGLDGTTKVDTTESATTKSDGTTQVASTESATPTKAVTTEFDATTEESRTATELDTTTQPATTHDTTTNLTTTRTAEEPEATTDITTVDQIATTDTTIIHATTQPEATTEVETTTQDITTESITTRIIATTTMPTNTETKATTSEAVPGTTIVMQTTTPADTTETTTHGRSTSDSISSRSPTPQEIISTISPSENPEIIPDLVTSSASSVGVQITILPKQGDIDKVRIITQRQPSVNTTLTTYYESSKFVRNAPPYAALDIVITNTQRRKRQESMHLKFTLGDSATECGPKDNPCNGPLREDSRYKIRYQLFSRTAVADYDFFDTTFTTAATENLTTIIILGVVIGVVVLLVIVTVFLILVILLCRTAHERNSFNLPVYDKPSPTVYNAEKEKEAKREEDKEKQELESAGKNNMELKSRAH